MLHEGVFVATDVVCVIREISRAGFVVTLVGFVFVLFAVVEERENVIEKHILLADLGLSQNGQERS